MFYHIKIACYQEDVHERAIRHSFLMREREGEEGTKDEWRKRDFLPSRLFRDGIIFRCERESEEIASSSPLTRAKEKWEDIARRVHIVQEN